MRDTQENHLPDSKFDLHMWGHDEESGEGLVCGICMKCITYEEFAREKIQ